MLKPSEALAKRVVEGVEEGARMVFRQDQSSRTHDFDLYRVQGTVAAVEVTSITDAAGRAINTAIARRRRIARRLCTKDWRIHPASDAVINRIAEDADAYLAHIEADGIEPFFAPRDASRMPSVAAIWRDLRVVSGRVFSCKEPGIGIALPVTGGAYGPSQVFGAMHVVASASDNREKLANSGAVERHLAIFVDRSATSVLMALRDFEPPAELPDLPAEITDVWLFGESYGADRYVVWRAGENRPWQRFVLAGLPEEDRLVLAEEGEMPVRAAELQGDRPLTGA